MPRESLTHSEPPAGDFRGVLQAEFIRRCRTNPRYSVRAFAKFLQIDSSSLSQFLRGRRNLSDAICARLGQRLGLPPEGREGDPAVTELTLDVFRMIADWYHHAIYELVTVKGFKSDSRWVARKLGIGSTEAKIAMDRLIRLELVQVDAKGVWRQNSPLLTTVGNPYTTAAFRKLQAQILQKAGEALEEIPMDRRDQSALTIAMHSSRLPQAKEMIKNFRRDLLKVLQQDPIRDSVYQLSVSLYPLTLNEKEKS